jgi:hypothetical protein
MAARALARARTLPLISCVAQGAARGFGLGAAGCVVWFGVINVSDGLSRDLFGFLGAVAFAGGVAGSIVGGLVGSYCWSLPRRPLSP